jgi:hypothetical protein
VITSGVTWYSVLGALPGAEPDQIQQHYDAKADVLRSEHVTGQPSNVVSAVSKARALLDQARLVLTDRESRLRYDEQIGIRPAGGGLIRTGTFATEAGWGSPDADDMAGFDDAGTALGVMAEMTDIFTPRPPRRPGRMLMPDVRFLFYSVCREVVARLGLPLTVVRLTEHPMPVDGLVIDQTPKPMTKARRSGGLTIQVWHPPARTAGRR